jgi:anti-sigma B factor antagonist
MTKAVSELPDGDRLSIERQQEGIGWRLVVRGELDLATALALKDGLSAIRRGRIERVVLDLRELSFMDCAGLHVILAADLHARHTGISLEVLYGPGQITRILNLTGADRQLGISAQTAANEHRAKLNGAEVHPHARQPTWNWLA